MIAQHSKFLRKIIRTVFINEIYFNRKQFFNDLFGRKRQSQPKRKTVLDHTDFHVVGGYEFVGLDLKALIATTEDDMWYFLPINDLEKTCVFPAMEISDQTLNGFNSVGNGKVFKGKGGRKMRRMLPIEYSKYMHYEFETDPSQIPDGW